MEFSTKRLLLKLSAIVLALASISVMAITASAQIIDPGPITVTSGFTSYSNYFYGDYSRFDVYPGYSMTMYTNSDYMYSWKEAWFYVFGENGNGEYRIDKKITRSTDPYVTASLSYDYSEAARKFYYGELLKTSNPYSSVKDQYYINLLKP